MKKNFLLILLVFIISSVQAQITFTIGNVSGAEPGTDIHIPVRVSGIDGSNGGTPVSAIELHLNYAENVLTYDTSLNFNVSTPVSQWFFGATGIEYSTNWIHPSLLTISLPDNELLFEIVYHYLGGPTELEFIVAKCEILDAAYNVIPNVVFINGQVSPAAGSDVSIWNGSGSWNTTANWSNGIPGESTKAVIQSGTVAVQSNVVGKTLDIASGAVLEVFPNYAVSIDSSFSNNGTFKILSDPSGTGSVIVGGLITGDGEYLTELYLDYTNSPAHLVASPVNNATPAIFANATIKKYNENGAMFSALTLSEILNPGAGYLATGSVSATTTFTSAFLNADLALGNLSYTSSNTKSQRGLNLVGNPFPSAIQWGFGDWQKNKVDNSIYAWEGYKYVSWNGTIGSFTDGIIPAMQGFYIKSNATAASVRIPKEARLHSSLPYLKSNEPVSDLLKIRIESVNDAQHYDETYIHIADGTTAAFDSSADAFKLFGDDSFPQIFTKSTDDSELSINTQPAFESIPIECKISTAGAYKLTFAGMGSFLASQALTVEDKKDNIFINIRNFDSYSFTSGGLNESGRFMLHFYEVGIGEDQAELFFAWSNGQELFIDASDIQTKVRINLYSLTGQRVLVIDNRILPSKVSLAGIKPGIYMLQISDGKNYYSKKILVF
jgi:hypothetical protein